jgi:hypothetical protein
MIGHYNKTPGLYSEDYDVSKLASGVYHCLVETSDKHESGKLIVVK